MSNARTFTVTVTILAPDLEQAQAIRSKLAMLHGHGQEASVWVGSVQEVSEDLARLETMLETIKGEPA